MIKKISEGAIVPSGWGVVAWRVSPTMYGTPKALIAWIPINLILRGVFKVWDIFWAWVKVPHGLTAEQRFLFELRQGFVALRLLEEGRRKRLYEACKEGLNKAWQCGFDVCNDFLKDKKLTDKEKAEFVEKFMAEITKIEKDLDKEYNNV